MRLHRILCQDAGIMHYNDSREYRVVVMTDEAVRDIIAHYRLIKIADYDPWIYYTARHNVSMSRGCFNLFPPEDGDVPTAIDDAIEGAIHRALGSPLTNDEPWRHGVRCKYRKETL